MKEGKIKHSEASVMRREREVCVVNCDVAAKRNCYETDCTMLI